MRKVRFLYWLWLALLVIALPTLCPAQISVGLSVHIGPPPLPVYPQPVCPAPGYLWSPGYWAYGPDGYYWVPGTWVAAPSPGLLWTPGYWGWAGGAYVWNGGYWGPHVGFYGGVNYGYGYVGSGYVGGHWDHGVFAYNTAVTNVNVTVIHNTYINRTVINNVTVNRVSYNGGPGGLVTRPTAGEQAAMHERHIEATAEQVQHEHAAGANRALLASVNHGHPSIAATSRAGQFEGHGVMAAQRAPQHARNNNVPRPPSSAGRSDAMAAHRNNNAEHGGAPHSPGRYQPVSHSHGEGGSEHRGGGEHHEGGERPH
ncbi:MAG TPA: YXWGXW repeat-containing protein [Terriglobales bacterium]|nr:YXWGXW repeat-containing protein [Terriglobales bacterium]